MKEINIKRRERSLIYSWPSLIFLMVITFFLVKGVYGALLNERESVRVLRETKEKVQALDQREQELRQNIEILGTKEGVEMEIRQRFGVSMEGEMVALLVEAKNTSTSSEPESQPWYRKLWSVIIRSK